MRRLLPIWFALLVPALAFAQSVVLPGFPPGTFQSRAALDPSAGGGGGCSQATTFLARTSGMSGTEISAYTDLICGMVTDGTWQNTDAMWGLATTGTANLKLNLIGNYSNLTGATPPTCNSSPDQGCTGDGASQFFDTNFNPTSNSSTQCAGSSCFTLNNAGIFACILNNRTTNRNNNEFGVDTGGNWIAFAPINDASLNTFMLMNDSDFTSTTAPTTTQGFWFFQRTSSSSRLLDRGSGGSYSNLVTQTNNSSSIPNDTLYLFARNESGAAGFSNDTMALVGVGGGYNSTDRQNIYNRIHTWAVALGISGC